MAQKGYRPQLDGVRAFCIIFTVFNHVPGRPPIINGSVGVDIFFALSGWLITWLLLEERSRADKIDLRAFYIRRFFRIVPLYMMTFVLYIIAATVTFRLMHDPTNIREVKAAWPYLLTFNSEYRSEAAGKLFGHAWTLGIEEKFYLVWPLLLVFLGRVPWRALLAAIGLVTLLFFVFGADDYIIRGYCGLGMGASLSFFVHRNPSVREFLSRRAIGGWVALLLIVPYVISLHIKSHLYCNIVIAALAAVMIASIWFDQEQPLSRFLSIRPLVWLGELTYAIYLLQTLAINVAQLVFRKLHLDPTGVPLFVLAYAISIGAAWVADVLIGRPCIRLGRDISKGLPRLSRKPQLGVT